MATLRQARRARCPEPVHAALAAEQAGADNITLHLREDRRHIQVQDVRALKELLKTRMNLEMAVTDEMLDIARAVRPADCCLVPGAAPGGDDRGRPRCRSAGAAPEGGDRASSWRRASASLFFVDPDARQIEAAVQIGAPVIELHTGAYAESAGARQAAELERLQAAARLGASLGLEVHAGHGLNYHNVQPVAAIGEIVELNIGHAIIARALFDGLPERRARNARADGVCAWAMNCLVFDIETMPDVELGRRIFSCRDLSDAAVAKAMFAHAPPGIGARFPAARAAPRGRDRLRMRSREELRFWSLGEPEPRRGGADRALLRRHRKIFPGSCVLERRGL